MPSADTVTLTGSAEAVDLAPTLAPAGVDPGATSGSNPLFDLTMLLFVAIPMSIVMALIATVLIRR